MKKKKCFKLAIFLYNDKSSLSDVFNYVILIFICKNSHYAISLSKSMVCLHGISTIFK